MLISIFYRRPRTVTPFTLSFRNSRLSIFSCKFCTVTCSYVNILLSKMKFLIAIVLYRVERKLTPLLKTNLSVSVLPVFPSFPSEARLWRCWGFICELLDRICVQARRIWSQRPHLQGQDPHAAEQGRAHGRPWVRGRRAHAAVWATPPWPQMDLCCVDAGLCAGRRAGAHRGEAR